MAPRPRLGELLQARGICTSEQLREAWEAKVLYGDRLGTNLLALRHVDEQRLARALGEQHGVHSGYGKVIKVEPAAVKLIAKNLAEKRSVVPHHVVDKQLFLLMKDPNDAIAIDEVRFATGLKVMPVVVCEARIWALLERHYGVWSSMRPVPLDGDIVRAPASGHDELTDPTAAGAELTSEEDFHELYAAMHAPAPISLPDGLPIESAHRPVAPPPSHAPVAEEDDRVDVTNPGRPKAILARRDPAGSESFLAPPRTDAGEGAHVGSAPGLAGEWRDTIEKTNPMLALPRFVMVDGEPRLIDESDDAFPIIDLVEVAEPSRVTALPALEFHVEVDDVVDESPLSFADATAMLKGAADRKAIAKVVLRAARTQFKRACLLTVYPDRIVGWMGLGEGMESERMRDVVFKRGDRSVFTMVVDSRSHYLGPLAKVPVHGAWVKATGRKIPRSLAAFPILVKGRPVNVLVVDNGHDAHVGSDVGELLILAQQIAKTYETLLSS